MSTLCPRLSRKTCINALKTAIDERTGYNLVNKPPALLYPVGVWPSQPPLRTIHQ